MTKTNLAHIEEVFHEAMSHDPDERRVYLERACAGDTMMRREVESLVAAHDSGGLLDQNAVTLAMRVIGVRPDESMVGQEVGVYKILSCLGEGGMGTVYLAEDSRLNRKVALKFLSSDFISDSWAKRQLIKEAQAVAMLDHPNICAVYGFEEIGEHSFIVMQYIEGQTLADLIQHQELTSSQIVTLALQIVGALGSAHAHGIIHRDIKPKNIMVTPANQVKVLDFGLAKTTHVNLEDATESISNLSREGLLIGTVAYMSPEQLRGDKLDYRSDIFSLGTVLYEMACGKNPYAHKTNAEVISAIMGRDPASLRQVSINCPKALAQIVRKCLQKDRADRYQSAVELLIDLEKLQKGIAPTQFTSYFTFRFAAAAAMVLLAAFVGAGIYRTWISRERTLAVAISCDTKTLGSECMASQIAEGLVSSLSRRKGLRVVSSEGTFSADSSNTTPPLKLSSNLNTDLVMFGNITRGDAGQWLTVHVFKVADGKEAWEKSYRINPDKTLALEHQISLETAFQLQLPTNEDDKQLFELMAAHQNLPTDAYTHYLLGRRYWDLRDKGEDLKPAIDQFVQATNLAPSYAEAYAGIADCEVLLESVAFGSSADPDAMVKAKWAAKKAIQFGDNLAESHNAYGSVLLRADWDWANAEKEFQRALAINPDYQPAYFNYSNLLATMGRFDEALKESELAMNLQPFSGAAIMNHCRTQYQAGQFTEADACLNRLAASQPNFSGGKYMHGIVYIALGRFQEAIDIYEDIYKKDKGYGGAMLGYVYGLAGRRLDAERILNEMQEYQKQHYFPEQELGIIYLGLDDMDHAFPLFRKAVADKYPPAQAYFFSPSWKRLRADPRFADLAREAGPPVLRDTSFSAVSNSSK